ncbi:uncharacterized protein LOC128743914 isoform X2 [Sabethes cyaneus]|nr:uncharacterized protein LOC128743914 isoform X2 [Sabethes cyaneus]XP_053696586.1 uncharacterized protein LOC128743914 isoform X2 [Sabethes cyaneus]
MQNNGKVGSMRTGIAVRTCFPGLVDQESMPHKETNSISVYSGKSETSEAINHSIVEYLVNTNKDNENACEPGPWSNKNPNYKRGPLFGIHHDLSFHIPMDINDQTINIKVDNLYRGIQLPSNHRRCNYPQRHFVVAACDDDKPSGFPMYNKICLYCRAPEQDFSPEEFHGYQHFKRRELSSKFFEQYESIWDNGAHVTIRLHPYHMRSYKWSLSKQSVVDGNEKKSINRKPHVEEWSTEEMRFHKWKNDGIKRYPDFKHSNDIFHADMEETTVQSKQEPVASRGVFPVSTNASSLVETDISNISYMPMTKEEKLKNLNLLSSKTNDASERGYSRKISKSDVHKRRFEESPPEVTSKKIAQQTELSNKDYMLAKLKTFPKDNRKLEENFPKIEDGDVFVETKELSPYYTNDSCSTHTFNMFVQSQSTPLTLKCRGTEISLSRQHLVQHDGNIYASEIIAHSTDNSKHGELKDPIITESTSTNDPKQLSTIIERTETSASSKLSVSYPADSNYKAILSVPELPSRNTDTAMNKAMGPMIESNDPFSVQHLIEFSMCTRETEYKNDEFDKTLGVCEPLIINAFTIHNDSSELLDNTCLVLKTAQKTLESNKRNDNYDEDVIRKNFVRQERDENRECPINQLTCKIITENTNNLPLSIGEISKLVKSRLHFKNEESLNDILSETPISKTASIFIEGSTPNIDCLDTKYSSFFDFPDAMCRQKTSNSNPPETLMTVPATNSNSRSSPTNIKNMMGTINTIDLHSSNKWCLIEDMNTEVFSLNMDNIKNSTLLEASRTINLKLNDILPQDIHEEEIAQITLNDKEHDENSEISPVSIFDTSITVEPPIEQYLGKSIYFRKKPLSVEEKQEWDEIDEHFNPENNEYMKKDVDLDGTMQFIYQQIQGVEVDPFDSKLKEAFLEKINFMTYIEELPTCSLVNKIQPLSKGMTENVNGTKISVIKKIGEGSFGTIYCGKNISTGEIVAMKQERPANLWEYYICLELRSRINHDDILSGFMNVDYAIIGNNASTLISRFSPFGNILDICNVMKRITNKNIDEFIAMFITSQILTIIDHLHSCMIIHADIKPDNFLLMTPLNLDSSRLSIQLIDFGVSIDLKLFPKSTTFTKVVKTECFTCIEMLENRSWTYQPDLYGVAGTTHVMLFGRYMEIQKEVINWSIKTRMPRYFRKNLWDNYFSTLLNIRDCNEMPNLQTLKNLLLSEINDNERYVRDKLGEFNHTLSSV